jgi:hypothetical protein
MKKIIVFFLAIGIWIAGCSSAEDRSKGVYMLLDTTDINTVELKKALGIISILLGTLNPNDTLAVASIDTGSFSEKDIIAKVTFNQRPSVANIQKRAFQQKVHDFVEKIKSSSYTDISGGILQAIEYLNASGTGKKYILIFSDLKEELAKDFVRDAPFQLAGISVLALNATKLGANIREPKKYPGRVEDWRSKVESGSGQWRVVNDLERLENFIAN